MYLLFAFYFKEKMTPQLVILKEQFKQFKQPLYILIVYLKLISAHILSSLDVTIVTFTVILHLDFNN